MKKDWFLISAVLVTLFSRLVFFFDWHDLWWDAGVYVGMGKFIFSIGQSGLWEHIRPPLLPFFLGIFWWAGLNPVVLGRILEILLMCGVVYFTYSLAKSWFDYRVAFVSALLVCFSPIFLFLSFHIYTEIPAVFLVLLSLWLFESDRVFWSGFCVGLAFLTKFPAGIFLPVIAVFLIRRWRKLLLLGVGFAIPVVPYLIISWVFYGGPFQFALAASDAIGRALGCNVLRYQPWYYYFRILVSSEIWFNAFAVLGVVGLFVQRMKRRYLLLACVVLPLLYFIQLHCRDYRYLTLFYPFVAVMASFGFFWIFRFIRGKSFIVVSIVLLLVFANTGVRYYLGEQSAQVDVAESYFSYLSDREISGEVWTSNPVIAGYTDAKLNKIYYPIYDDGVSKKFIDYLRDSADKVQYVLLDNCGGGLICAEEDAVCAENTEKLIDDLDDSFNLAFNETRGRCWYKIWATS